MADTQYDLIDAEYVEVKDQRVYSNQWRPNPKTVAYYPLDAANQYNDCSGHNYHLTKNTYASQGNYGPNVECCYFNSRSNSSGACGLYRSTDRIFNSTDGEKKYTILFWIWYDGGNMYYNPRIVGRYNGEIIVYNGSAFGCYDTYNGPTMSSGSWNLIGANLDFNTKKISWYKNGEYVSTQTYPDGLATQADGIVLGTRDSATTTNYGDKFSGYMGDVIVEQGLRDKDSHKRFYNQTRKKYHIFEEGDLIAFYPLTQNSNDANPKNKRAPFNFNSTNVTFSEENGASLNGSTNLITRPYSFMHGDFPYTVCFSFKTNTITNTRGEFFSFMRDVSGTRAPLLSLRERIINLDYNGLVGGTFPNFGAMANRWYRVAFVHSSGTVNKLYINGYDCGTVTLSSAQNCGTNAMHIGQEMDNQSRFNGFIKNFRITKKAFTESDVQEDYEKFGGDWGSPFVGVYHSSSLGLISVSSDGQNWVTIADRNLGATSNDVTSSNSFGNHFQRGNNYGFPNTGSVPVTEGTVDASTYGPGNYYSSSTFRIGSGNYRVWEEPTNLNLRGGQSSNVTDRRGPCAAGYHIPLSSELYGLIDKMRELGFTNTNANNLAIADTLKIPLSGIIRENGAVGYTNTSRSIASGNTCYAWFCTANRNGGLRFVATSNARGIEQSGATEARGNSIRPFKDTPVVPDSSWTKLF